MNPFIIYKLMTSAATLLPSLKGLSFGSITPAAISGLLGDSEPLLAELGSLFSPSAPAAVHAVIAATALALDGHPGSAIQSALNAYLAGVPGFTPLVTDGKMGPKTSAAIMMAQTKGGIKADGWFGMATAELIGYAVH